MHTHVCSRKLFAQIALEIFRVNLIEFQTRDCLLKTPINNSVIKYEFYPFNYKSEF